MGGMQPRFDPSLLAATPFSPSEVERLCLLYEERCGVRLSDEQAIRYGRALVLYVALVCRVVKLPDIEPALDESRRELN